MVSNAAANVALYETVWLDANRFYDAESRYYVASLADLSKRDNPGPVSSDVKSPGVSGSSLASEIAYARQKIQNFLKSSDSGIDSGASNVINRLEKLEKGQEIMKQTVDKLTTTMNSILSRLSSIETCMKESSNERIIEINMVKKMDDSKCSIQNGSSAAADDDDDDDDDDIDLFGSDEDDVAAEKLREERLQAYANKKAKKPALVAKSSVVLDVKPWDDETDMKAMEKAVRAVQPDGLVWGASKLVPLAFGISKLQIIAVVEDDKVSIDWLQETICELEDVVQSVDIAAFNKL